MGSYEPGKRKVHILLIEDNPGDVEILRLALRNAELDCELTVIDDGGGALAFLGGADAATPPPDLVILDLNLPKHDGLEILEAMRANPSLAEMPVALLSSSSSPRERSKLDAFRVGRYITKPPDLDGYLRVGFTLKEFLAEICFRAKAPPDSLVNP